MARKKRTAVRPGNLEKLSHIIFVFRSAGIGALVRMDMVGLQRFVIPTLSVFFTFTFSHTVNLVWAGEGDDLVQRWGGPLRRRFAAG